MRPARVSRPHPHRVIPASAGQRTRADWHVMTGLPYLIRVVVPTLGLRKPKVPVRGMDVAGTVEAVGPT